MISIVNKFFKKKNNQNPFSVELKKLKDETQVTKIFKSISDFSDESEIRYVGGCIRKILNNEKVVQEFVIPNKKLTARDTAIPSNNNIRGPHFDPAQPIIN